MFLPQATPQEVCNLLSGLARVPIAVDFEVFYPRTAMIHFVLHKSWLCAVLARVMRCRMLQALLSSLFMGSFRYRMSVVQPCRTCWKLLG